MSAWAECNQSPSRHEGLDDTDVSGEDQSALCHFTWHLKNERGVQFVAKD